jgi:hypothetical protein
MGLSAKDSRVYLIPKTCPIRLNGSTPSGARFRLSEQVTRIEITPSVYQRKYGHDKSYGANDVCSGIKSWDGSITTKVASGTSPFTLSAADTVWIRVYPMGVVCRHPLQGYASIDSDPIVINLENGEPVEHNYRYSSKGLWKGFPNDAQPWGGYECQCVGGSGSEGGSGASGSVSGGVSLSGEARPKAAKDELLHTPVTAYQWNGTEWIPVYDECREGFARGPVPVDAGAFVGQLQFVECQIG